MSVRLGTSRIDWKRPKCLVSMTSLMRPHFVTTRAERFSGSEQLSRGAQKSDFVHPRETTPPPPSQPAKTGVVSVAEVALPFLADREHTRGRPRQRSSEPGHSLQRNFGSRIFEGLLDLLGLFLGHPRFDGFWRAFNEILGF